MTCSALNCQKSTLEARIAELEDQLMEAGKAAMKIQAQFEQQSERVAQLEEDRRFLFSENARLSDALSEIIRACDDSEVGFTMRDFIRSTAKRATSRQADFPHTRIDGQGGDGSTELKGPSPVTSARVGTPDAVAGEVTSQAVQEQCGCEPVSLGGWTCPKHERKPTAQESCDFCQGTGHHLAPDVVEPITIPCSKKGCPYRAKQSGEV